MKNIILIIFCLLSLIFPIKLKAKQYNITSYHKIRYIDGKKCKEFYTYQNGREILINVICE